MKKRLILITLVVVTALFAAGPARADLVTLNPINPLLLEIIVGPLPAGTAVGGYDITIGFNPLVVAPLFPDPGTFPGPYLGAPVDSFFDVFVGLDSFEVSEVSLLPPSVLVGSQPPEFVLATISFAAVGQGDPGLLVLSADLADQFGNPIGGGPVIPEPATCVLIGSGLALLARYRKTRRA